jgi:hypothetical protein
MYKLNNQKTWNVPQGRYYATLESAFCREAGTESEKVRLVFKLRDNTGAETESRAGINFRTNNPDHFAQAIPSWLGQEQLDKLFPDRVVTEENLHQLIGRNAILEIANENHGQVHPLVVIRQIFPDNPAYLNAGAGRTGRVLFRLPISNRMHLPQ